jgi:hypothetical protein
MRQVFLYKALALWRVKCVEEKHIKCEALSAAAAFGRYVGLSG